MLSPCVMTGGRFSVINPAVQLLARLARPAKDIVATESTGDPLLTACANSVSGVSVRGAAQFFCGCHAKNEIRRTRQGSIIHT